MAELLGVEWVVIHGYAVAESTGRAIQVPATGEDAEPGDMVVGPVVSEPVALADQRPLPLLRALNAQGHVLTQPVSTTPVEATGYYALASLSTNDPDAEPYKGRRVTLPDGTAIVISLPYNATPTLVDQKMADQVNAGRATPIVTVGQQVRAVWLPAAAEYVAPEVGPAAFYTADQVDALLTGLLDDAVTEADLAQFKAELVNGAPGLLDTFGELAAKLADDESVVAALTSTVAEKLAKAANLSDLTDKAAARQALQLGPLAQQAISGQQDATTVLYGDWVFRTPSGGGGGSGAPDVPENPAGAQAAAATANSLLSLLTSFTTASAITQSLPQAIAGRYLGVRWESGVAALTLAAASRSDTATVTSGSPTVTDAAIQANDQGRLVTGTGVPPGSYVGTVTPGTSFLLSSSPAAQVNVNATGSGSSVVVSDLIGAGTATTRTPETPGEVLLLHCTTGGRWRTWAGFRPSERLTPVGPKTGAYTAASGELVKVDATSAAVTITAPASGVGRAFAVKKVDASANVVTVARAGSDTLGSAGATTLPVRYDDQATYFGYDPTAPTAWLVTHNHLPPTAVMAAETGTAFRAQLATTQSIPNNVGAGTIVSFPTITRASALVTQATQGAGHQFTLNRAGVWMGSVTVRFPTATSGEAYVAVLATPGGIVNALGSAFGGATATRCLPISGYFDAATVITVSVYQNSGAAQNIDHNSGNWCHIDLNWMRP